MINSHLSKETDLTSEFINPNWHQSKIKGNKNSLIINSTYNISFTNQNGRQDIQIQFSSVQSLSRVRLFATPRTAAHQASLSITSSWNLLKLMSIELVMPSNHLILCRPLILSPSIFPSIRVFPNESALHIRWPKYGSFNFNISPSNETFRTYFL